MQSKVFGVMGPTGSGKSHLCNLLAKEGGFIIDADKIGHNVLKQGHLAYNEVTQNFQNITNEEGNIDRKKLGAIVFGDKAKLLKLNKITHKYIFSEIEKEIQRVYKLGTYKFIIIDAAILIEIGLHRLCDKIILVTADESVRQKRIMARDGLTKEQALKRIRAQKDFALYKKYADHIVCNDDNLSSIDFLEKLV